MFKSPIETLPIPAALTGPVPVVSHALRAAFPQDRQRACRGQALVTGRRELRQGLLRNASVRAAAGLALACACAMAALNASFWPESSRPSSAGGRCAVHPADTSTTPGSAIVATRRCSNLTALVIP